MNLVTIVEKTLLTLKLSISTILKVCSHRCSVISSWTMVELDLT